MSYTIGELIKEKLSEREAELKKMVEPGTAPEPKEPQAIELTTNAEVAGKLINTLGSDVMDACEEHIPKEFTRAQAGAAVLHALVSLGVSFARSMEVNILDIANGLRMMADGYQDAASADVAKALAGQETDQELNDRILEAIRQKERERKAAKEASASPPTVEF